MNGKKELQEIAENATGKQTTNACEEAFKLTGCTLEHNGDVTCEITKGEFDNVSASGVKPKQLVFTIKD